MGLCFFSGAKQQDKEKHAKTGTGEAVSEHENSLCTPVKILQFIYTGKRLHTTISVCKWQLCYYSLWELQSTSYFPTSKRLLARRCNFSNSKKMVQNREDCITPVEKDT